MTHDEDGNQTTPAEVEVVPDAPLLHRLLAANTEGVPDPQRWDEPRRESGMSERKGGNAAPLLMIAMICATIIAVTYIIAA